MHASDGVGPQVLLIPILVPKGQGAMEVRNGSDVPGVTGLGACAETSHIINEISDYHFNDLQGKPRSRGWVCHRSLQRRTPWKHAPGCSSAPVPNQVCEKFDHCSGDSVKWSGANKAT